MTPHIALVSQRELLERDAERFGVRAFVELGYKVAVLDCADLIYPCIPAHREAYANFTDFEIRIVRRREDLAREARTLADAALIIVRVGGGVPAPENLGVLQAIARSGAPTLALEVNPLPTATPTTLPAQRGLAMRLAAFSPMKSLIARLPPSALGLRPLDFMVHGGRKSRRPLPLVTGATTIIDAHASDYDTYLVHRAASAPTNTAIYLDPYMGYHDDFIPISGTQPIHPDQYYPRLRALFDQIEYKLGLEVVIAAHPRADYRDKPALYGTRRLITGRTAELVRDCSLVLSLHSTSINFAVLFRKPAVILGHSTIQAHPIMLGVLEGIAAAIGKPLMPLDTDRWNFDGLLSVDETAYDRYMEDFIKPAGSPDQPLWTLVADRLAQLGVLPDLGGLPC